MRAKGSAISLAALVALALTASQPAGALPEPDAFQPLDSLWPAPSERRLATGEPGPAYWQQRADYDIKVELDPAGKRLYGSATINYFNESPHRLDVLWMQLDQNRFRPDSRSSTSRTLRTAPEDMTYRQWLRLMEFPEFDGGMRITRVTVNGRDVPRTILDTLMRLDLPEPLQPGGRLELSVDWWYPLVDLNRLGARSGYETLANGHDIFVLAQWYPRMSAYTDYGGWRHKSFLGAGEFTLEFGNFQVAITLPEDYVVASTGELQNATQVLTAEQRRRYVQGQRSDKPVLVFEADEVRKALRRAASRKKKTWVFRAESVRDFAFAASRTFLWDTMGVNLDGNWITVMSFYPEEVAPLWGPYASRAAALALEVYSRQLFNYPYPVSVQVNGPVFGMEYPMLTFMSSRPYPDGTYWGAVRNDVEESVLFSKDALIGVTIHEVGHNFFPMIVNSDERHWAWLDEGLNTFVQFLAEREWSKSFHSRRGWPHQIGERQQRPGVRPIMSDADTLMHRSLTGYDKPAAALNVLRELVLGREVFDRALRVYANRWKFRRPTPSDFFRSMEDAAGTDLDWFWRTWFYDTGHVDLALNSVRRLVLTDAGPDAARERKPELPPTLIDERNRSAQTLVERMPELKDFYDGYDPKATTAKERADHQNKLGSLTQYERELLEDGDRQLYLLELENRGGTISPVPLRLHLEGGETEDLLVPAEVWRYDNRRVVYPLVRSARVLKVEIDPQRATGDSDLGNNFFPPVIEEEPTIPLKPTVPDNPMRASRNKR